MWQFRLLKRCSRKIGQPLYWRTTARSSAFLMRRWKSYTGDKDARLAEMCNFVKEQDPRYCCMVKVEQSYASALPEEDQ